MKKLAFISLLFLIACQESPSSHELDLDKSADANGIVRGTEVAPTDEIAKIVFSLFSVDPRRTTTRKEGNITYTQEFGAQCTTSPLTKRIAITAAHCVDDPELNHRLEIHGANGKKTVNKVIAFKIHPGFTSGDRNHRIDLALLLLEKDLPEGILYPTLPNETEDMALTEITASGYGKITGQKLRDGKSGILRTAKAKVINYKSGEDIFVIDQHEKSGICSGDSGGPGYDTSPGGYKLVGIAFEVEFYPFPGDENPDTCNTFGRYVNVQNQLGWIKETSQELLSQTTRAQ